METVLNILFFIVGLIIGAFLFFTILFPLLYMFPKAIFLSIKGKIKSISILVALRTALVVTAILVIVNIFFPSVFQFVERPIVNNGSNIAMTLLFIGRFLFKSGRIKSDAEFWLTLFKYRVPGKWMEK